MYNNFLSNRIFEYAHEPMSSPARTSSSPTSAPLTSDEFPPYWRNHHFSDFSSDDRSVMAQHHRRNPLVPPTAEVDRNH